MTGREREALERKARSLFLKLMSFADDLERIDDTSGTYQKLQDAAVAVQGLVDGPLAPGTLSRQRYAS